MATYGIVNVAQLNLRSGPSTSQPIMRVLVSNEVVEIISNSGEWAQVKLRNSDVRGFVVRQFLNLTDSLPAEVGDDRPTPMTGQGEVTGTSVNIRSGPSTQSSILTTVRQGTRLNLVERRGQWLRVRFGDIDGYIATQFVRLIIQPLPNPTPTPTPTPAPKPLNVVTRPGFLISNPELISQELLPRRIIPQNTGSIARTWNNYGGLLTNLANLLNIPVNVVVAVIVAESGGQGFGPDGRMIIRFENHIFFGYWGRNNQETFDRHFQFNRTTPAAGFRDHTFRADLTQPFQPFHGNQSLEWQAFNFARGLDEASAMFSISMGAPQVMGFNFSTLGYTSVQDMFQAFSRSIHAQLIGVFDFVRRPNIGSPAIRALQNRDYLTFASIYNGPANARTYQNIIQSNVVAFDELIRTAVPR
jgi:uncharacterized protein YraI